MHLLSFHGQLLGVLLLLITTSEGVPKKTPNNPTNGNKNKGDGGSSGGYGGTGTTGYGSCENATGICNPRTNLISTLFSDQIQIGRPYCGNDDVVNVTVDVALRQLMELDEPSQVLKVYVWMRMKWNDCNLVWNASDYGGIDNIIVPFETIWIPDITLYDSAAESFYGYRESRPQVYNNGDVIYNFPSIIESQCQMNVRFFPFDIQKCTLTFGSWAYHGFEVDFNPKMDSGDLSTAQTSTEWEFHSFYAKKHVTFYRCCPEPYPDVRFHLVVHRKPLFYMVNIIIPTFLVTLIAVLVFLLPVESGEKVGLSITIMLALSVFQLLVSDSLPPSAETVPLIALFFDFMLFLCAFATVTATVVINIYFIENRPMSKRLKNHVLFPLAKILCIYIPDKEENEDEDNHNNVSKPTKPQLLKISKALKFNGNGSITMDNIKLEKDKTKDEEPVTEEWKLLSVVIDRFSLIVFLISFVIGTIVIAAMYGDSFRQQIYEINRN